MVQQELLRAGDITDAHRELGEDLGRWRRISMRELSLDEGVFFHSIFFLKLHSGSLPRQRVLLSLLQTVN